VYKSRFTNSEPYRMARTMRDRTQMLQNPQPYGTAVSNPTDLLRGGMPSSPVNVSDRMNALRGGGVTRPAPSSPALPQLAPPGRQEPDRPPVTPSKKTPDGGINININVPGTGGSGTGNFGGGSGGYDDKFGGNPGVTGGGGYSNPDAGDPYVPPVSPPTETTPPAQLSPFQTLMNQILGNAGVFNNPSADNIWNAGVLNPLYQQMRGRGFMGQFGDTLGKPGMGINPSMGGYDPYKLRSLLTNWLRSNPQGFQPGIPSNRAMR